MVHRSLLRGWLGSGGNPLRICQSAGLRAKKALSRLVIQEARRAPVAPRKTGYVRVTVELTAPGDRRARLSINRRPFGGLLGCSQPRSASSSEASGRQKEGTV